MPRTKAAPVHFATFGDVLRHLRGVHPRRIPISPAPGAATVRDVIRLDRRRHEGGTFELVNGVLVAKLGGFNEAVVAGNIAFAILNFQERRHLGAVAGASGLMQLAPKVVRAPTVSFVSWDQLPGRVVPRQPVPRIHPDLAIEVLCRGNTKAEMIRKRGDYFAAGTRLVWQVDWRTRTVDVYTDPDTHTTLAEGDTLDGGDVLPGFACPDSALFQGL